MMEIEARLDEISSVKKKLHVEVPEETTAREFERVAKELKQRARIPGFRPGKAPLKLIKRRFAGEIESEVIRKLVPDSYEEAIKQQGLSPLGQPDLENLQAEEGKPLTYEAHFEVRPEVQLPKYRGLELEVEPAEVTEEAVQEQLEQLREQGAQMVAVEDRPVAEGDHVVIDLKGEFLDQEEKGEEEPIDEEDVGVAVGDENTHSAFNEALPGMNIGEEKTFEVEYPEDYPEDRLAGRKVRFTAEVTDIKVKVLPELNDEFAKDLGDFESLAEIEEKVRTDLAAKSSSERESALRNAVTDQLVDASSFEVPDVMVEARVRDRMEQLAQRLQAQGIEPAQANLDWAKMREDMIPDVKREVRARLLLDQVAVEEGIEITQEDLEEEWERLADSMNQPKEKIRQYFLGGDNMDGLKKELKRQKAMSLIIDSAEVKEPKKSKKEASPVTEESEETP